MAAIEQYTAEQQNGAVEKKLLSQLTDKASGDVKS
jgi:hypothetical protein